MKRISAAAEFYFYGFTYFYFGKAFSRFAASRYEE